MPSRRLILRLVCLALLASPVAGVSAALSLRVMTFNLRFASDQSPNAWPDRRPVMKHLLEREAPDLVGTQEGVYRQLGDLAADLPAYEWIGLGRDGGSRGEFMAVFYRRDRFEPVAYDHFWLSDTPAVIGSMTWGNVYPRMVTWVRFRDRTSGREFYFCNTHFDHQIEQARQKAAQLLRDRLASFDAALPVVLTGDFNCAAGASAAYETLTREAALSDTWTAAAKRDNEDLNTFHNYQPAKHEGERIDWILARPLATVKRAAIITFSENGQAPSDHFPVLAEIELR